MVRVHLSEAKLSFAYITELKPWLSYLLYLYPWQCFNSYLWTYDLYGPVHKNAFDVGKSITRGSGRGFGLGNRDFFGPCEMTSNRVPFGVHKKVEIYKS
jgi:hypothetical protein